MTKQEALFHYALRLGDNALILGHRLSELTSFGPILEEDLAMSNLALDLLGEAQGFLTYAGEIEGKGQTADDLAYKRAERKFVNNLITELPNGDFADTMTRHFLYSHFALLLFEELVKSKDETIAALAAKSLKEMKYHVRHSSDWMLRLGDGTAESHQRAQKALDNIWMFTGDMFTVTEADELLQKEGIAADLKAIYAQWDKNISAVLETATLKKPANTFMQSGSQKGVHTESLGFILAEMQYLQRAYPDAKW